MQEDQNVWRGLPESPQKLLSEPLRRLAEPPILYQNYDTLLHTNLKNLSLSKYEARIKQNTELSPIGASWRRQTASAIEAQPKKPKTQKAATRKCTKCNNPNCSLRTCTSCRWEVCAAIKCQNCQNWFCNLQAKAPFCFLRRCDHCKKKVCSECREICNNSCQSSCEDFELHRKKGTRIRRTCDALLCDACMVTREAHDDLSE